MGVKSLAGPQWPLFVINMFTSLLAGGARQLEVSCQGFQVEPKSVVF